MTVRETVDARKTKLGADDLPALFADAESVTVGQGKKSATFARSAGALDMDALVAKALGRSGNLRAPAMRVGRHWLVGYCEPAWDAFFSGS